MPPEGGSNDKAEALARQGVAEDATQFDIDEALEVEAGLDRVDSESRKMEQKTHEKFENRALDIIEELMDEKGDPAMLSGALVGFDSDRSWALRKRLLDEGLAMNNLLSSIAGLDSDAAWDLRDTTLSLKGDFASEVVASLAGVDSSRSWEMRNKLMEGRVNLRTMAASINGLDSDDAGRMRERLSSLGFGEADILATFSGIDSVKAWNLREKLFKERDKMGAIDSVAVNNGLLISLAGLDSPRAWEMRDALIKERHADKINMCVSLIGLDSQRANVKRLAMIESGDFPEEDVAISLAGLNSYNDWRIRDVLMRDGAPRDEMARSLSNRLAVVVAAAKGIKNIKESTIASIREAKVTAHENVPTEEEKEVESRLEKVLEQSRRKRRPNLKK